MSVGTPFHPRTSPLNRKMQWREWSGYFASSVYADAHDIEYNAIREAAALIDVSPLYKYIGQRARRAAPRRPGRHPRRDEAGRRRRHLHAVVRRARQGRRRRHDPSARRGAVPLDRRRPAAPLAPPEQRRARRDDRRGDRGDRRARAPGSALAGRPRGGDRRVVRRPALLPAPAGQGRQGQGRRLTDRLHRRPRLRAVDPDRRRGQGLGRADGGRRRLRRSGRRGCSPSTSSGSRPG